MHSMKEVPSCSMNKDCIKKQINERRTNRLKGKGRQRKACLEGIDEILRVSRSLRNKRQCMKLYIEEMEREMVSEERKRYGEVL